VLLFFMTYFRFVEFSIGFVELLSYAFGGSYQDPATALRIHG
jgi:hypothetical protein